jgi:hypothetical protein
MYTLKSFDNLVTLQILGLTPRESNSVGSEIQPRNLHINPALHPSFRGFWHRYPVQHTLRNTLYPQATVTKTNNICKNINCRAGGIAQEVEHLPSKDEVPRSNPSTIKKKKNKNINCT